MNPHTCYTRTALGKEELKKPALGLRPRCRQLLFVLDGKLSVEQLHITMPGIVDLEGTLQDMLRIGLICPDHEATPAAPAPRQHDDLAMKMGQALNHSADSGNRFEDAKLHAVDMMIALFGAKSSHVDKLLLAKNKTELLTAVTSCKKILAAVASSSKAQDFEQSVIQALEK